jgi:hypothetical protein
MDTIAVKENVFSGMYGDVVVGFSDAYVLTNEFSIFVFDGAPPAKTKYEISHPVVMINNSEIHGGRSFPIFMHEKDFYTISSLDAYSAATGEGIGRFDEIKFVRGKSAVKLRNYPRQAVFLKKGRFDLTLPENIKGITIEKLNPVKMVDEGIGPEMRGYFLNWIKK